MRRCRGLAAAAGALGLIAGCSSSSSPAPPATSPPAGNSSAAAPETRQVRIAGPVGLTAAGSGVWAVAVSEGAVIGYDAKTGRKLRKVDVGDTPLRVTFDGKLLWVSVFGAGKVVAVDPGSGKITERVSVPGQPEGIVSAFGAIWVVRQQARKLTRVSPTGAVGPSYPLGREPRLVAASGKALFVADVSDGTVTRIDPQSGKRTVSKQVCDGAQNLADQQGTLWVTCTRSNMVVAVDERSLKVTRRVTLKGEPDGIRVAGGSVFVVTTTGPTVYELPGGAHGRFERRAVVGKSGPLFDQANDDLVVAGGRIWASDFQGNLLVRTTIPA